MMNSKLVNFFALLRDWLIGNWKIFPGLLFIVRYKKLAAFSLLKSLLLFCSERPHRESTGSLQQKDNVQVRHGFQTCTWRFTQVWRCFDIFNFPPFYHPIISKFSQEWLFPLFFTLQLFDFILEDFWRTGDSIRGRECMFRLCDGKRILSLQSDFTWISSWNVID